MDRWFVGFTVLQHKFEVFASNQDSDTVLKESGYDFVAGPFAEKEAKENCEAWQQFMAGL